MSTFTPKQSARLATISEKVFGDGVFVSGELLEKLRTAIEGLRNLEMQEEQLIKESEARNQELRERCENALQRGNEIAGQIRTTLQASGPLVETPKAQDQCHEDDVCDVTKAPNYYAKLEGSGWTLTSDLHTFSEGIQKILTTGSEDTKESEAKKAMDRMTYLMNHPLDSTCLDLYSAGSYMDSILWHFREQGDWALYQKWYDQGIQFTERLMAIQAKDSTISLEDVIFILATNYKHYKAITKA